MDGTICGNPIRALEVGGSAVASRTSVDMKPQSNVHLVVSPVRFRTTHEWTVKCKPAGQLNSAISSLPRASDPGDRGALALADWQQRRHGRPLLVCEKQTSRDESMFHKAQPVDLGMAEMTSASVQHIC